MAVLDIVQNSSLKNKKKERKEMKHWIKYSMLEDDNPNWNLGPHHNGSHLYGIEISQLEQVDFLVPYLVQIWPFLYRKQKKIKENSALLGKVTKVLISYNQRKTETLTSSPCLRGFQVFHDRRHFA